MTVMVVVVRLFRLVAIMLSKMVEVMAMMVVVVVMMGFFRLVANVLSKMME